MASRQSKQIMKVLRGTRKRSQQPLSDEPPKPTQTITEQMSVTITYNASNSTDIERMETMLEHALLSRVEGALFEHFRSLDIHNFGIGVKRDFRLTELQVLKRNANAISLGEKVKSLREAANRAARLNGYKIDDPLNADYRDFVHAYIHGAMHDHTQREACYEILMKDYGITADEIAVDYIGG